MLVRRHHLYVKETNESFQYNQKTQTAQSVWKIAKDILGEEIDIQENLYALYFNNSMIVQGYAHLSKGDIGGTIMPMSILYKYAIDLLATSIVVFHNHPSGNLNPSSEDRKFTEAVRETGKLLNIRLLDSLIVTKNGFYSIESDENVKPKVKEESYV